MSNDPRCCGTGTCIIDGDGRCWCGQVWDGEKMCFAQRPETATPPEAAELPGEAPAHADTQPR